MNKTWHDTLKTILDSGSLVSPRGKQTMEIPQHTVAVRMRTPVLTCQARALSYKFMAAEAYWILSGDSTVNGIAPWNKHIAQFSDDGDEFFGAYGPRIAQQLGYVVRKLISDRDTRQACLTIWRENPPATKDVPCTVALTASIRGGELNVHVFMRSSDVWLGLPYDVFNFSMLGHFICSRLNAAGMEVSPGTLYLTAASSHLYEPQWKTAQAIVDEPVSDQEQMLTPQKLFQDEEYLMTTLRVLRETSPGDQLRWWEHAP